MKIAADRYAVAIAYFLIYVVWGSTYYFIGVALEGLPTFLLGALRFSVAGAVLLLLCHIRGEKVFRPALIRRPPFCSQRHCVAFCGYGGHYAGAALCEQQSGRDCRFLHSHLDYLV